MPTIFPATVNKLSQVKVRGRHSSEVVLEKKRKQQILCEAKSSSHTLTEVDTSCPDTPEQSSVFDANGPLIATPIQLPTNLETLAAVACNTQAMPVHHVYHAQCQTPASWNRAKVEVALISCGTQTDWERDVQADSDLKIPMASASMCEDSFLSSLNHSREDESCDVTWEPSDDEDDDDDSDDDQMEWEGSQSQITGRKFIVSESCLDKLLNKCSICNKPVVVNKTVKGCLLVCSRICDNCNETQTWESQPTICGLAEGHLDLSAAIMFSGSATAKFLRALRFAGISCFNDSTFYNIQKHYLSPSVEHVWKEHQTQLTSEIRDKGLPIVIGGDGRCCSPGHTAKYGTYSVMDLNSGKILDIQLVQSNEVKNSHAMELEGLQRSLTFLRHECGLQVSHLVTDRHSSVKKYMREQQPDIIHWFDVWHVAKGIYKKLEAAGKKKGCEKVKAWSRSVSNHLYWCVASSDGDGEMVKQKWLSMLNHVANIHEGHGDKFPRCEHGDLEDRLWMKKGFKPHAELSKVVENKLLLTDIQKLSPAQQTSDLEAFHKVMCSWAPKSVHYMHTYMESRSKVSALHFNENAKRDVKKTKHGVEQYSVSYPKGRKGEPVVKDVKTEQTFGYVTALMAHAKELRVRHSSYRIACERKEMKARPLPLAQSTPKRLGVSKELLVKNHVSRFNR